MNAPATLRFDPAPAATPPVAGLLLRDAFGGLALAATVVSVVGLFAVSPLLLEAGGIAYISSGGGALAKLHPSTIAAAAALVLRCCAARHPARLGWQLLTRDSGVVLLGAAVAVAAVYAITVARTPVTPLVDSFVLPVLIWLLLRDLDPRIARLLAAAIAVILVANALIAFAEFLRGWRLVTIDVPDSASADPTRGDTTFSWQAQLALDWRASALLGHPLVNGLIVGAFALCLLSPAAGWLPVLVRLPLVALEVASLFTFGARAAIVLTLVMACWLGACSVAGAVARGARITPRGLGLGLLGLGLAVAAVAILAGSGFLDRTLERFSQDSGSASTRLTMFGLLESFSFSDLLFSPDKDVVATQQRLQGLEFGIESSWLGLVLTYGLVVTGLLIAGLAAFARTVMSRCGSGSGIVFLFFFLLISASASLSGKTTTLAMTVALIVLFLRRDLEDLPGRTTRVMRNGRS